MFYIIYNIVTYGGLLIFSIRASLEKGLSGAFLQQICYQTRKGGAP